MAIPFFPSIGLKGLNLSFKDGLGDHGMDAFIPIYDLGNS
jgi:hypothetical protein